MKLKLFFIFSLTFFLNTQNTFSQGWHQGACKADAKKFCSDVKAGGGRLMACLKQHEAELSAECKESREGRKTAVKAARENHKEELKQNNKEIHQACKEDAAKLCPDIKPGGGRIIKCMKGKIDQASEACKKEIKEGRSIHESIADEAKSLKK